MPNPTNTQTNEWMTRMTCHQALTSMTAFMVDADNPKVCMGLKVLDTGQIIKANNPRVLDIIGTAFSSLQEAMDYDFSKDMSEAHMSETNMEESINE